ncbi:MAG: hypothetical protein H6502_02810 [Candidatus Woesearchaeota archaeon]|nr:MAG: hypothetical protein H6502_02810 [Candidatus Woesearchaeota archaeon]
MLTSEQKASFKAYDIRAKSDVLTDNFSFLLGKASGDYFKKTSKKKSVVIGRDGRLSSPRLHRHFVKGILASGMDVEDIGIVSTPQFYYFVKYAAKKTNAGGVMITASHLQGEYNGFKFVDQYSSYVHSGNGLGEVLAALEKDNSPTLSKKRGKRVAVTKTKVSSRYESFLSSQIKEKLPYSLVIDVSNGSGQAEARVLRKLAKRCKVINGTCLGTFPAHDPDPLPPKNRKQLENEVKKNKADFGIIFDGDADRMVVIDKRGNQIESGIIALVLAKHLKQPRIVSTCNMSLVLENHLPQKGTLVTCAIGRSKVHESMKKIKANIGAERSGHFYFKQLGFTDAAGLAAIHFLSNVTPEDLLLAKESYMAPETNIVVANKDRALKRIESAFAKKAKQILRIDGISLFFEEYWFNIRASNTEELLRITIEGKNKKTVDAFLKKIQQVAS